MNNALKIMIVVFNVSENDRGLVEGLLQSTLYCGCFIGSLLGVLVLPYGIKRCLTLVDILIILGAAML
jgi:predicted MFS family arabinose efflux permease